MAESYFNSEVRPYTKSRVQGLIENNKKLLQMRARLKDPSLSRTTQARYAQQVNEAHSIQSVSMPASPRVQTSDYGQTLSVRSPLSLVQRLKTSQQSGITNDSQFFQLRGQPKTTRVSREKVGGSHRDGGDIFHFDQETLDGFQLVPPKVRVARMKHELKSKAISVIRDKFNPKSVRVQIPKQAATKEQVYRSELSPVSIHLAQQSYDQMCTANYKAGFEKNKGRLEVE